MNTTESKFEKIHFDMQGEWFTWMLRHLWIEENEFKAIKFWHSAFPHLSSPKYLKTIFIDIVSGKSKFTGYASDENGFTLDSDGRTRWDPKQDGKEVDDFPLLNSWEDVLRKKRVQLFVLELKIIAYRTHRNYPVRWEDCENRTNVFRLGLEENITNNSYIKEYQKIYIAFSSICKLLKEDPILLSYPDFITEFTTSKGYISLSQKYVKFNKKDNEEFYRVLKKFINDESEYFLNKYGYRVLRFSEKDIEFITEFSEKESISDSSKDDDDDMEGEEYYAPKSDLLDTLIKAQEDSESFTATPTPIDTLDKSSFTNRNGYISPDGEFYKCSFIQHRNIAETLVEHYGYNKKDEKDAQIVLDNKGWVKLSQGRFVWDYLDYLLSASQLKTIEKLMKHWDMKVAEFTFLSTKHISLHKAFEINKEEYKNR